MKRIYSSGRFLSTSFLFKSIFTLAICLFVTGCQSKDWKADTYKATGTVKINGEPPIDLVVTFHPIDHVIDVRGSLPFAVVGQDGGYTVSMYGSNDGIPEGKYAITLRWPQSWAPGALDRLSEKYSSKENSVSTVEIVRGDNEIPAIELKSVKVLGKNTPAKNSTDERY